VIYKDCLFCLMFLQLGTLDITQFVIKSFEAELLLNAIPHDTHLHLTTKIEKIIYLRITNYNCIGSSLKKWLVTVTNYWFWKVTCYSHNYEKL